MASIVLTFAGSALGNAVLPGIGGPILAGLGGALGSVIDQSLFGSSASIKGPRLDQLKIQDSSYGNGIPIIYGRNRLSGNVIWASDLQETLSTDEVGGKGGGGGASVERASYSVDCAIAIGQGPIGSITTIWADSKVIYSNGSWTANVALEVEFYLGDSAQDPSPLMESALGVGLVPAYRGISYVVFHQLQLANFGNRLPNFTFEVAPVDVIAPEWLGDAAPLLIGRPDSFAMPGALPPLALARRGARVTQILVGGITQDGTDFSFTAVAYDISGDAPVELARVTSDAVSRSGDVQDFSWGLSPDGRHVAFYMQHFEVGDPIALAIYDASAGAFGAVLEDNLGASSAHVQMAWCGTQAFVLADTQGSVRGLRVYAASGVTPVLLGFYDVWGSGSSSTRFILPFAQFAPIPGGLLHVMADHASTPSALYARSLRWQNGGLDIGEAQTLSSGMSSFSGSSAALMALGDGEFVLARASSSEVRLLGFTAGYDGVSVTRNWTVLGISPSGAISVNAANGKIVFLHQRFGFTTYRYGEISLTGSSFSLDSASITISGSYDGSPGYFSIFPVDSQRYAALLGDSGNGFSAVGLFRRMQDGTALNVIVGDLLERAGYETADYDVDALADVTVEGYTVPDPTSARAAIEPLQAYAGFDLVENDGLLAAKLYSATEDAEIDVAETSAASENDAPPPHAVIMRAQEQDIPAEVVIDHLDPALDYQKGSQRARRQSILARAVEQVRLPVVCSAAKAKEIAAGRLYRRWMEREKKEISVSRAHALLSPGDVVALSGQKLRVTEQKQSGGLVKLTVVPVSASIIGNAAFADTGQGASAREIQTPDTVLFLMDIPLLRSGDDAPGFYAAASGVAGWKGAGLYRSADGVTYTQATRFSLPVTAGIATSVLADAPPYYMDRVNSVTVSLLRGSLSSCTETDLLNGANAALLGDEIIQFQNAALNSDGSYTLSNILRGRRGTEDKKAAHVAGERFVLLQQNVVTFLPLATIDRGRSYNYRGVSVGQDVSAVGDTGMTHQLKTLEPLAPVHIKAVRNGGGDITLTWVRRARRDAEWQDLFDVPLDEAGELYDIEIMDGGTVARVFSNQAGASVSYSAADQVADFGSAQASVDVRVYQVSSRYGRGGRAEATV